MGVHISMAVQINLEELAGCKSYFGWICDKIDDGDISRELCRVLFDTDFTWEIAADEIRARDAMNLRKKYSEEVGKDNEKTKRESDRIWKSIHGKCSVLELLLSLCIHMDEMVNEEENSSLQSTFFSIMIRNLELDKYDDEDFDLHPEAVKAGWNKKIERFLNRKYNENGCGGGLFPLKSTSEDQRQVSIWYQMNAWIGENLDEDEHFIVEKWCKK